MKHIVTALLAATILFPHLTVQAQPALPADWPAGVWLPVDNDGTEQAVRFVFSREGEITMLVGAVNMNVGTYVVTRLPSGADAELVSLQITNPDGSLAGHSTSAAIDSITMETPDGQTTVLRRMWASQNGTLTFATSSSTDVAYPELLSLVVTSEHILLGDNTILSLDGGALRESDRLVTSSLTLPALQRALQAELTLREQWARVVQQHAEPAINAAFDRDTPYATVLATIATAYASGAMYLNLTVRYRPVPTVWADEDESVVESYTTISLPDPVTGNLMPPPGIVSMQVPERLTAGAVQVGVGVLEDGFILFQNGTTTSAEFETHLERSSDCPAESRATICVLEDRSTGRTLNERLPFRELYNRLVAIHNDTRFASYETLFVYGGEGVPYSSIVRTMDVARHLLEQDNYRDDAFFYEIAQLREEAGQQVPLFQRIGFVQMPD